MAYDLELLVINQEEPAEIPFMSSIEVLNEIEDEMVIRFSDKWKIMSQTKGIWYSLVKSDGEVQNAYLLCDSNYNIEATNLPIPFWIKSEEVIYNLTPLIIKQEYREDFINILAYLLGKSPSNTAMFLARYQGEDYEVIQGIISIDDFIKQLDSGNILFNVCYVINK